MTDGRVETLCSGQSRKDNTRERSAKHEAKRTIQDSSCNRWQGGQFSLSQPTIKLTPPDLDRNHLRPPHPLLTLLHPHKHLLCNSHPRHQRHRLRPQSQIQMGLPPLRRPCSSLPQSRRPRFREIPRRADGCYNGRPGKEHLAG